MKSVKGNNSVLCMYLGIGFMFYIKNDYNSGGCEILVINH